MKARIFSIALATVSAAAIIAAGVAANGQTVGAVAAAAQVKVAERADDFRLVDHKSKTQLLSYYKNSPAVVIISQQNGAKAIRDAAAEIKALQASFASKEVPLLLLNSNPADNRDTIAAEMASLGLDVPVLLDDTQLVGEGLGVSRVAQAIVIQPKTWKVVYSGPISAGSKTYVADAVNSLVAGTPVKVSMAEIKTPLIAFPNRDRKAEFARISYEKEISPILAKNCVSCHAEGGIAPFAMNSYDVVKQFGPMIREAIRTDRMPPYNADPHVGQFKDDMNLPVKDAQTLVHWIEAGSPRGAGEDPLKINAKVAPEWELGEPDLVLTLPSFAVPASGIVDYQNPMLKNPLTEGRWLRASTIKVGDRQAVHHLLSPVGGYAVGAESTVYPADTGTWVEPGQNLRFQLHYTPYGKATTDVTKVGLYFYPKDKPPSIVRRNAVVLNAGIEIKPNAARHKETAYSVFPGAATLYSVFPHAHYRGENVEVSLLKPGAAKEELILSLPKYDFNWQRGYEFKTPIQIAPGTKLITRYEYDNSKNNPANPDPSITVKWGEQSHEEMQYTAFGFRWNEETVENRKPEYQKGLEDSRIMGMMDVNIDGKVAKDEVRGRMAQLLIANWDKVDANKDGFLTPDEMGSINQMMTGRINEAQNQQSIGQ
ncbi:MAG TPA: redoxin domain-containing protein [Hyphomonadaceae bacterium]|nr:redoxin domain-containing protein [Hyphomonadaceae bacterium]